MDKWHKAVMAFVFVGCCLTPTDIFPPYVREHFLEPYFIKAVPAIVTWCIILAQLLRTRPGKALPAAV